MTLRLQLQCLDPCDESGPVALSTVYKQTAVIPVRTTKCTVFKPYVLTPHYSYYTDHRTIQSRWRARQLRHERWESNLYTDSYEWTFSWYLMKMVSDRKLTPREKCFSIMEMAPVCDLPHPQE